MTHIRLAQRGGFTLIETMLGMVVLLTLASAILPSFTQDLVLGRMSWERRLAMKTIESEIDWACEFVRWTAAPDPTDDFADGIQDFDQLGNSAAGTLQTQIPSELTGITANTQRTVDCPNPANIGGPPLLPCDATRNLKRVSVQIEWDSRGRNVSENGADYLISRTGGCES